MRKKLKEKLNTIKSKINKIKDNKQKDDNVDFSNKEQRERFYKQLKKEIKDNNNDYQKRLERREYLDRKEVERRREQGVYERFDEFDDCRF